MEFILSVLPWLIIIALVLIIIGANVKIVPQSRAFVIERLGAFRTVWGVGLHFKVPIFERVAKNVSLKEQVVDFPPQPVITKDNVTMQIDTVIYFQITDPKLYAYGVENPMAAIENLTATTLRNIIGDLELDQSLTSRDHINGQMRAILDEATDNWGIKVQPGGAEKYHAAPGHPGVHGEADAGRAGAPRGHSPGRRTETVPDPGGGGREAVRHPAGRRGQAGGHPPGGGRQAGQDPGS